MKMYRSPSIKSQGVGRQDDKGFTLIEILIAIVLVGILSAVAVIGISNLVSKGGTSACTASADAAKAASVVYFTSHSSTYADDFLKLTSDGSLTLPAGVTAPVAGDKVVTSGTSWKLTMTGGGTTANTFTCGTP